MFHGDADEGFGLPPDAFAANFAHRSETGVTCAVYVDGKPVVHLRGGDADAGGPWRFDAIVPVFSVTKALLAISAYILAEQGRLRLDDPIADLWPEFAETGKIGSGGAVGTATGLARIMAATVGEVDGVRLLGDDSVRDALTVRSEGLDWEGNPANRFSTGFMVNGAPWRPLLSDASFGHDGACGQLAFADADANLGFGYVNGSWLAEDVRAERLVLALRECLG